MHLFAWLLVYVVKSCCYDDDATEWTKLTRYYWQTVLRRQCRQCCCCKTFNIMCRQLWLQHGGVGYPWHGPQSQSTLRYDRGTTIVRAVFCAARFVSFRFVFIIQLMFGWLAVIVFIYALKRWHTLGDLCLCKGWWPKRCNIHSHCRCEKLHQLFASLSKERSILSYSMFRKLEGCNWWKHIILFGTQNKLHAQRCFPYWNDHSLLLIFLSVAG